MKLTRSTLALVAAASLVLTACGDDSGSDSDNAGGDNNNSSDNGDDNGDGGSDSPSGDATDGADGGDDTEAPKGVAWEPMADLSGTLSGAGASSIESAMASWRKGYNTEVSGVTINYDAVGSGGGREQFLSGGVDFAGSDAYLDEDEIKKAESDAACGPEGAIDVPLYISPIALPYNLEGVEGLQLKPETIAKIFTGQITSWDDEAIVADNPDAELPAEDIVLVHRSDDSGTTENFADYLSQVAPDVWTEEPDKEWKGAQGESGAQTSGVINLVSSTPNSIGYADASAVGELSSVKVGVGDSFTEFSPEAAAKVVDVSPRAEGRPEGDMAIDLDHKTQEAGAYPIVLISYGIACKQYKDEKQADMVKNFLQYIVSGDGQKNSADAAGSAPLSDELAEEAMKSLDSIESK